MRKSAWLWAWLAGGALMLLVTGLGMAASLTPYAYVELTKQTMERTVQDLSQLRTEITSFNGDGGAWINREAQLNTGFKAQHEALCADYGVSTQEYALFYAANAANVESYLDAHPDDGSHIEDLEAQISASLTEYEQLKSDLLEPDPPVPDGT